jgi:hypothetical protein
MDELQRRQKMVNRIVRKNGAGSWRAARRFPKLPKLFEQAAA